MKSVFENGTNQRSFRVARVKVTIIIFSPKRSSHTTITISSVIFQCESQHTNTHKKWSIKMQSHENEWADMTSKTEYGNVISKIQQRNKREKGNSLKYHFIHITAMSPFRQGAPLTPWSCNSSLLMSFKQAMTNYFSYMQLDSPAKAFQNQDIKFLRWIKMKENIFESSVISIWR